jgi:hypothetical protein
MGLMSPVAIGNEEEAQKTIDRVNSNDAEATASVWTRVGGIKIACLTDTVIIHDNGDVEGPMHPEDLQKAPVTFCKTRDAKSGLDVMVLLAVNGISRVADVCVYDPRRSAREELLYSVAGSMGSWLRVLLGDGWGLRIEVYCDRYAPTEVPEMNRFWVLLMVILKAYLPHVRMVDTQAAIRVECMAQHTTMRDLLSTVVHNVDEIVKKSPPTAKSL